MKTLRSTKYIQQNDGHVEKIDPAMFETRMLKAIQRLVEVQKELRALEQAGNWSEWPNQLATFMGILLFLSNNIPDEEIRWRMLPYDIAYDEMLKEMQFAKDYDGGPGGGGDWWTWKEETLSAPASYEPWPEITRSGVQNV
jgi:hypothetical protein